jgi:hypothetical protein
MTPEQYIDRIGELVASRRDREALDLSVRVGPGVHSRLTDEEYDLVSGMLESAAMVLGMQDAAGQPSQPSPTGSSPGRAHRTPSGASPQR